MSDACHDWEPGGWGCLEAMRDNDGDCPSDRLGDYTFAALRQAQEFEVGEEAGLGLCEGHCAIVVLRRTETGFYHHHVPVVGYEEHTPDELLEDTPWTPATPSSSLKGHPRQS